MGQKTIENCKKLILYSVCGYKIFFLCSLPRGSKNSILLRKYFYWIMSFCDPEILRDFSRSTFSNEVPLFFQLTFLGKCKTQFLQVYPDQKRFSCWRVLHWKICCFVSRVTNTVVWKFQKMPSSLICVDIQTEFSQPVQVWFIYRISFGRSLSCTGGVDWKAIDIFPSTKRLIDQRVQKVVTKNDSTRLSKRCFSVTTVFISFMRVKISNPTFWRNFDPISSHLDFCSFFL